MLFTDADSHPFAHLQRGLFAARAVGGALSIDIEL
jgi:hypothetical protein